MAINAALILFVCFFALLVIGVPISVGIGLSAIVTTFVVLPPDIALFTVAQKMITGVSSFSLLAVPLFVLSGNIMNNGGIARRLVNLAKLVAGRVPGSLAHTNVLGNMLFGALSGSAVAACAAIGGTMAPLEKDEGYDDSFSAAVNIASCATGMLIPPSGVLILYALTAGGVSISALFMAGYLPGILMGVSVMIVAFIYARKHNYTVSERVHFKEGLKIILDAIPSLLMIVIVIGGIVGGAFTATEGAAVSVAYPH